MKHRIGLLLFVVLAVGCARQALPVGTDTGYIVDNLGDNVITGFYFDRSGYVWMTPASGRYLFKTDGSIFIRYESDPAMPGSLSASKVNDVTVDAKNRVWVATQKGVDRYDPARGCFDHIPVDDSNHYVIDIAEDGSGRIAIVTRRGLMEMDEKSGRFVRKVQIPLVTPSEPQICFDSTGNLWLRLDNSLLCFDKNYNQVFKKDFDQFVGRPVYDGNKYIWATDGERLLTVNIHSFKEADAKDLFPELDGKRTGQLLKVADGILVVSISGNPYLVDVFRDTATDLAHAEGQAKTILEYVQAGCRALQKGPNGNLWIADREGGFKHHFFNRRQDPDDKEFLDFLVSGDVQSSTQDERFIWLLSNGKIVAFDRNSGHFTSVQDIRNLTDMNVASLSAGNDGTVLLCSHARTSRPLELFKTGPDGSLTLEKRIKLPYAGIGTIGSDGRIYAVGTGTVIMKVEPDGTIREITNLFNDYACYATLLKPLSDGSVLICLTDHAPVIFHPEDERVEILEAEGFDQVYFSAYTEDAQGRVWIGTSDKGLFLYDKEDKRFSKVRNYPETTVNSLVADSDGNVFVLGNYSTVHRFGSDPDGEGRPVWTDYSDFPPARRLFRLPDGSAVLVGKGQYEWFNEDRFNAPQAADLTSHIYLTSGKRILCSLSADDYPNNRVALHLDRNTEDLNLFIGVIDRANPFSRHTFFYDINHFRTGPREAFDKPQIPLYGVSRPYNTVRFRVTEPFTLRIWMNLLPMEIIGSILLVALVSTALLLWLLSRKKKEEAEAERLKREMTEKLNMENIDFFANISHEFRTPLTLIHGAASSLETEDTRALGIIRRNTERMMRLVSQMLDFNKLDHGILKLHVKEEPVMDIIRAVKSDFEIGASVKGLQLNLETDVEEKSGYVDRDKLEKVLYNLCSNAVKYTPPGGQVDLTVSVTDDDVLQVSIADTGIGIPEDALEAVFERFYRTKGTEKAGGTGIGLYYTRALVNLHHGSIRAIVRKDADKVVGSVFSFSLPLRKEAYSEAERGGNSDAAASLDENNHLSEYVEEAAEAGTDSSKPSVMLIDDDYEIVYYLKNLLSHAYNVFFRFDAMSGYKMIEEVQPDIIVCDMMMLEMDGLQLCRMVKENLSMSHIPFVMLTAKSTMQDQIDSLGAGADAYVVKPFEPGYLMALIKSMIDNRNRVRKMLGSSLSVPKSSKEVLSGQDNDFMEKLYNIMKKSLHNGELDIDPVAEKLGVSRSKFYYKVKALTGQTPNEFFTTYKLNYAAEMIKQGKYKISAIADMLGFSSSSHFAALFKKQFGTLPSQYSGAE